jgi:hypothetical protein
MAVTAIMTAVKHSEQLSASFCERRICTCQMMRIGMQRTEAEDEEEEEGKLTMTLVRRGWAAE